MKSKFDRVFYSIAMFSGILLLALSFTIKQTNAACNDINCSLTNCVYDVEEYGCRFVYPPCRHAGCRINHSDGCYYELGHCETSPQIATCYERCCLGRCCSHL